MIRCALRYGRTQCVSGRRDRSTRKPSGRDVLWRAECNALLRSLADHGLTTNQAGAILCCLGAARARGCELGRLGQLTGLDARVLDRAVPLLGLRYAAEAAAACRPTEAALESPRGEGA